MHMSCIDHIYFIFRGNVLIVKFCDLSTTYEIKYKDGNNLFLLSYASLLSPIPSIVMLNHASLEEEY